MGVTGFFGSVPASSRAIDSLSGELALSIEAPTAPTPDALPVLADALEAHGGDPLAIAHCCAAHPHGRRCWVLESLR